jgi:hypothetical protein
MTTKPTESAPAKPTRAEPPKATPAPDRTIECHAMVRAAGSWIHFEASIPESVVSQYVTRVSDPDIFGMHVVRLNQALNRQKERG